MQVLAQFFKNGVKRKGGGNYLGGLRSTLNMIILMMMMTMVSLTTMLIILRWSAITKVL